MGDGGEIIVVGGGSTDKTVAIAAAFGARVLTAPRGRGTQIAASIAAATHPWLLLLHADTIPSPDWRRGAEPASATRAGYFRFVPDSAGPRARRLERLVAWRSVVLGLPYGGPEGGTTPSGTGASNLAIGPLPIGY